MPSFPTEVAGFSVLPVQYANSIHILYARPHQTPRKSSASDALPAGRTLFLVNVPPDATEREFTLFFKHCGTIERVLFDQDTGLPDASVECDTSSEEEEGADEEQAPAEQTKKRKRGRGQVEKPPPVTALPALPPRSVRATGRSAHIVFLDASSLNRLSSSSHRKRWPTSSGEPSGLALYAALHDALRPSLDVAREHADSYMALFEYEQDRKKQKAKYRQGEAIVDEDGFTLVTRGGAYGQTLGGGVGVANKKFKANGGSKRARKRSRAQEKDGFYAFQRAEKQRAGILEMQRKWEEDKAKVEKLKQSKQFKPY